MINLAFKGAGSMLLRKRRLFNGANTEGIDGKVKRSFKVSLTCHLLYSLDDKTRGSLEDFIQSLIHYLVREVVDTSPTSKDFNYQSFEALCTLWLIFMQSFIKPSFRFLNY